MNKLNFNQEGGFRLSTNILDAVQASYNLFNALGYIAGNFTIISGCELHGNTVSDGVVFINGEVYNFKGGTLSEYVIIQQDKIPYPFQNGDIKDVVFIRYVAFGTSIPSENFRWSDFKRLFATKDIQEFKDNHDYRIRLLERKQPFVEGMIIRYDQPLNVAPPEGWIDWNPDHEQGRTWVARSDNDRDFALNNLGGEKTHSLNINEMPAHNHDTMIDASGDDDNSDCYGRAINTSWNEILDNQKNRVRVENKGGNQPHNNLQPYVAVRFIKYIGLEY